MRILRAQAAVAVSAAVAALERPATQGVRPLAVAAAVQHRTAAVVKLLAVAMTVDHHLMVVAQRLSLVEVHRSSLNLLSTAAAAAAWQQGLELKVLALVVTVEVELPY